MDEKPDKLTRRELLGKAAFAAGLAGLGATGSYLLSQTNVGGEDTVWQLDPDKCIQCGKCATNCVLTPSAVKCVHAYAVCGYCRICFGYFDPKATNFHSGAENQLCPAGAIKRTFIEDPYYEYTIDEKLCIGCGKCVEACAQSGNGALFLQVRHDRCVNCNECAIAAVCPSGAFRRVPASRKYLLKGEDSNS